MFGLESNDNLSSVFDFIEIDRIDNAMFGFREYSIQSEIRMTQSKN